MQNVKQNLPSSEEIKSTQFDGLTILLASEINRLAENSFQIRDRIQKIGYYSEPTGPAESCPAEEPPSTVTDKLKISIKMLQANNEMLEFAIRHLQSLV